MYCNVGILGGVREEKCEEGVLNCMTRTVYVGGESVSAVAACGRKEAKSATECDRAKSADDKFEVRHCN